MPFEAGSAFPVPDRSALTARVLDAVKTAGDAKSARALAVRELQIARTAAISAFEVGFLATPAARGT